jgi:hypothetical protein
MVDGYSDQAMKRLHTQTRDEAKNTRIISINNIEILQAFTCILKKMKNMFQILFH